MQCKNKNKNKGKDKDKDKDKGPAEGPEPRVQTRFFRSFVCSFAYLLPYYRKRGLSYFLLLYNNIHVYTYLQ